MILGIVGKTNSGKDTAAKYLFEKYKYPMIVSYTTRPKRAYEDDGVQHWFIDKSRMAELIATKDIIAYTKNEETGIEYCAVLDDTFMQKDFIYIINPEGIRWFKEHGTKNEKMISIYMNCAEDEILKRGELRGDDVDVLNKRLSSERKEFDDFYNNKEWDYVVNSEKPLDDVKAQIHKIIEDIQNR